MHELAWAAKLFFVLKLTNLLMWMITRSKLAVVHRDWRSFIPFGAHFGLCNIANSALRHGKQQVMSSEQPERSRRASLKRGNVISPDPARYVTAIFPCCTTSSSNLEGCVDCVYGQALCWTTIRFITFVMCSAFSPAVIRVWCRMSSASYRTMSPRSALVLCPDYFCLAGK